MSGNKSDVFYDFPDGLLFVGPEDPQCIRDKIKSVRFKEACEFAIKAKAEGKELTTEDMLPFVEFKH